jgi:hypothetical protein
MLMLCPICAGEYQKPTPHCPGCGCGLIPSTFDERTAREINAIAKRQAQFVELCRPRLYPVAMLIKQTLESHDVTVIIQGGHSLSVMPNFAFMGEIRVLVAVDQLEQARAIYTAYFESSEEIDYAPDE